MANTTYVEEKHGATELLGTCKCKNKYKCKCKCSFESMMTKHDSMNVTLNKCMVMVMLYIYSIYYGIRDLQIL